MDGFGSISGVIVTSDGQGASFVSVIIKGIRKGTTTNDKGHFQIDNLKPGIYTLTFLCWDTLIVV